MSENKIVNALIEAINNAPGPKRELIVVGRLLVACRGNPRENRKPCPDWDRGCKRHDLESWIGLMITPGRKCSWR